jgi:hypothetical protein
VVDSFDALSAKKWEKWFLGVQLTRQRIPMNQILSYLNPNIKRIPEPKPNPVLKLEFVLIRFGIFIT